MSEKIILKDSLAKMHAINKALEFSKIKKTHFMFSILMREAVYAGKDLNECIQSIQEAEVVLERELWKKSEILERLKILEKEINELITADEFEQLFNKYGGQ